MKKILLFLLLGIFMFSFTSAFYCYQESFNVTNQTGIDGSCSLNYSGSYETSGTLSNLLSVFDGNWDSYGNPGDIYYVNYSKPETSFSTIWQVKYSYNRYSYTKYTTNVSIIDTCFNFGNNIQLRAYHEPNIIKLECYNGTWNTLYENLSMNAMNIGEEAMYWNIDSTAPTINLSYPIALIDYGKINGTLQLNFTATDTSLDKVWYNYNGTNVTIAGAVSGVYNISNITLSTKKNVTIYANDTAGNLNATTFSWDYKVFENSRTYNSTSYETATEGYQINLTANTSLTAVALEFNGTDYPMTGSYTYSMDLPTSSVGNNSIRYKFTYGAETIYSDYTYQNVLSTVLALCNATYPVPYLNITFKDEATLGSINATMPLGEFDYYLGSGTVTKQLQFINTSENERYSFCASPSTRTLNIDPYVQYASSGYPQRIWNPTVSSYSNTTTSQVLYLLSSSDGIYVTFQVINSADQLQEGVEVSATRQISGSDVVVASGTTDAAGSVTFWLNPDFSHDFSFSKTGFTTYETSFSPTQTSYTITLGGDGGSSVPNDYTRGISLSFSPTQQELFNGTAYTFSFTVDSSFWDLDSFGYNLRLANGTIVASPSSTTSGVAASNSYNVNNQSIIYMDYYWIINGTTTSASKYWIVTNTGYSSWSIKHFFTRLNTYMTIGFFGIDNFGRYLIVFIVLFITIGIMSYKYGLTSPIAIMSMIFLVIYFFDNIVGLIPIIRGIPHLLTYLAGIILAVTILKEVTS